MQSLSTTSIPADRSTVVQAKGYRLFFFLLNFNNNYVNELTRDLAKQCPNGRVEGILTKTEELIYFPLIAHGVRVTATGFCIEAEATEVPDVPEVEPEVPDTEPEVPAEAPEVPEVPEAEPEVPAEAPEITSSPEPATPGIP